MLQLNPEIFREYDIRGVVDRDLTPQVVEHLGKAYATYLGSFGEQRAVVGRDNRLSSDEYSRALINGLTSAGCDVVDIGLVVTPIFYFSRILYGIDGGVMITGSHNPPEFNGFKLARGHATIYGGEIQKIRRIMEAGDYASGAGSVEARDPVPDYYRAIRDRIRLGERKLKAVVDCGNGTASLFGPSLLESLGCEVVPLYCEPDGRFPNHFPDPVKPENLRDLIGTVRQTGADLGIAYDGDADRIGAVDELGNIIWGDMLMILFWREILPRYPGALAIIEVKCSQALVDEVSRLGGRPMFYRTGHSLIKAKMKETGAVFTGEMSGHMFFADEYYGYDDALYASARLLRILSRETKSLSQLLADVPVYHSTPETRVDCPDSAKFKVVEEVRRYFADRFPVVDVDGVRVMFPRGWGLVRASNTQPVIVVRCEAADPQALEEIKGRVRNKLMEFPEVEFPDW